MNHSREQCRRMATVVQLCTSRRDDLSGQIVESCFEVEVVKEKIHFQEEVLLTAHKFKWEVLRQFN